jgi:hypothetical protein
MRDATSVVQRASRHEQRVSARWCSRTEDPSIRKKWFRWARARGQNDDHGRWLSPMDIHPPAEPEDQCHEASPARPPAPRRTPSPRAVPLGEASCRCTCDDLLTSATRPCNPAKKAASRVSRRAGIDHSADFDEGSPSVGWLVRFADRRCTSIRLSLLREVAPDHHKKPPWRRGRQEERERTAPSFFSPISLISLRPWRHGSSLSGPTPRRSVSRQEGSAEGSQGAAR